MLVRASAIDREPQTRGEKHPIRLCPCCPSRTRHQPPGDPFARRQPPAVAPRRCWGGLAFCVPLARLLGARRRSPRNPQQPLPVLTLPPSTTTASSPRPSAA